MRLYSSNRLPSQEFRGLAAIAVYVHTDLRTDNLKCRGRGSGRLSEGEKRQRDRGILLWLVGLNPGVLRMVQKSALGEALGREAMHFNLEVAVTKYLAMLADSSGATGSMR